MMLDGYHLHINHIYRIAVEKEQVTLSTDSLLAMERARGLVLKMVDGQEAIYGLNTGLGKNKDRRVGKEEIEQFNQQLIYAHCVGIEPELSSERVRAAMVIKLNSLLKAYAGVQLEMAYLLRDLLNYDITPIVNSRGSIGEGDIGLMSYIGLVLIGQGEVLYKGKRRQTIQVFREVGLTPLRLYAKDGLAIISSNAISYACLSLQLTKLQQLITWADLSYSLSLEALNGNVTPLDPTVTGAKRQEGQEKSAQLIRCYLEGSYLYEKSRSSIQDPLSFRNACLIHGAVYEAFSYVERQLHQEFQSADDNPMVDYEGKRIISTPHYDTLSLSLAVEMLNRWRWFL